MRPALTYEGLAQAGRSVMARAGVMPLCPQLNAAVMTMANATNPGGWEVVQNYDAAPRSLDDLNAMMRSGRLLVWAGGSEQTIFGCAEHNYAFRAWHDAVHYALQAPFTISGEAAVAYAQIAQLVARYGEDGYVIEWAARILSEVIGQAMYAAQGNDFPADQIAFSMEDTPRWMLLATRLVGHFHEEIKAIPYSYEGPCTRGEKIIRMAAAFAAETF